MAAFDIREIDYELKAVAPALSLDQCLEYFELESLGGEDLKRFKRAYTKSKYALQIDAINAVKAEMSGGKDKLRPALAVLLRFSDEWDNITLDEKTPDFVANINLKGG